MWTLGGTRIYVTDKASSGKQIIARLQPLAGPTIQQVFGYETNIIKLTCKVVGETDLATILGMKNTGTKYELLGNGTDYGEFYVASISEKRDNSIYQTITAVCADPVFTVELELT